MKRLAFTLIAAFTLAATTITASAQSKEETRTVSDFNSVAAAGPFNVHIKLGNTESLTINADQRLLDKIETFVENGGSLQIKIKKSEWKLFQDVQKIDVYITAKSLKTLVNSGSGTMTVDGLINADSFTTVMSGSGSISASAKANEFHAVISGSGSVKIDGSASKVDAMISGSGQLQAKDFSTSTAKFTITGSGEAYIHADKEIHSSLIGSGSVFYTGNAQISTSKIGSGKVTKVD